MCSRGKKLTGLLLSEAVLSLDFYFVCWCAVKDRYGDREVDDYSDSSESSSDDSEVVSIAFPLSICQQELSQSVSLIAFDAL